MKTSIAIVLVLILLAGCTANKEADKYPNISEIKQNKTDMPNNLEKEINKTVNNTQATGNNATKAENKTSTQNADVEKLTKSVLPSKGINLTVKWKDVGKKTVESGALNLTLFKDLMKRNGKPLTEEQLKILESGSDDYMVIDQNNSYFILNVFWAFGLVNDNPILRNGTMSKDKSSIPRYASTGGWPLGNKSGGSLYSSTVLIMLSQEQQEIADEVASSTYRPCCNNPTSFPDCNHGMAALGLAEWLAYQNASKEEIYTALLAANSYWFPQTYLETAAYFESQNISWNNVSAKEILSFNYSSATGYYNTKQKLKGLPGITLPSSGCGV